jgi:hypothetical protein
MASTASGCTTSSAPADSECAGRQRGQRFGRAGRHLTAGDPDAALLAQDAHAGGVGGRQRLLDPEHVELARFVSDPADGREVESRDRARAGAHDDVCSFTASYQSSPRHSGYPVVCLVCRECT